MGNQHRISLISNKMFKCNTCNRSFSRLDALRRHERTLHSKLKNSEVSDDTDSASDDTDTESDDGKPYKKLKQEHDDGYSDYFSVYALKFLQHALMNASFGSQKLSLASLRKLIQDTDPSLSDCGSEITTDSSDYEVLSEDDEYEKIQRKKGTKNERRELSFATIDLLLELLKGIQLGVLKITKVRFLCLLNYVRSDRKKDRKHGIQPSIYSEESSEDVKEAKHELEPSIYSEGSGEDVKEAETLK